MSAALNALKGHLKLDDKLGDSINSLSAMDGRDHPLLN
jgi:hypothetical protein